MADSGGGAGGDPSGGAGSSADGGGSADRSKRNTETKKEEKKKKKPAANRLSPSDNRVTIVLPNVQLPIGKNDAKDPATVAQNINRAVEFDNTKKRTIVLGVPANLGARKNTLF